MVLGLFGKSVSQRGESTHPHSHHQILPLNKAGADMFRIRLTDERNLVARHTLRRAIASLAFGVLLVHFHQLRVVNGLAESVEHGSQISLQAVRGKLYAIHETGSQIGYEGFCGFRVPLPESPAGDKFGVSINRGPGPGVSSDLAVRDFLGHLFLLAITEGPAFIYV